MATSGTGRREQSTDLPRGSVRGTAWLLLLGAAPVALVLLVVGVRTAAWQSEYLLARKHRDTELAARQVWARLDGLGAECESDATQRIGCPENQPTPVVTISGVRFSFPDESGPVHLQITCTVGGKARCTKADPRKLIGDTPPFDDVLIVRRSTGSVLAQRGYGSGLSNLGSVMVPAREDRTLPAWLVGSGANAAAADAAPSDWGSATRDLLIGGRRFTATCAAVVPHAAAASADLAVCGLVEKAEWLRRSLEVPQWLLATALTLLALAGCAWPVLRLAFLGPTERLRIRSVRLLAVACCAGAGIAAVLVVGTAASRAFGIRLDKQQATLTTRLSTAMLAELERAAEFLRTQPPNGGPKPRQPPPLCVWADEAPKYVFNVSRLAADGTIVTTCERAKGAKAFVALEPNRKAGDRTYLRDLQAGNVFAPGSKARDRDVALESIRTKTRGDVGIAVARQDRPTNEVLVLAAWPVVPVLPPGYEFAVIDRHGDVKLDDDHKYNLEYNLFSECAKGEAALRSAIESDHGGLFNSVCYGDDFRVHVQSMPGTPWWLVTLRARAAEQDLLFGSLDLYAVGFAAYLALMGLGLVVLELRWPLYRMDWIWPHPLRTVSYAVAAGAAALVGLAALRCGLTCTGWWQCTPVLWGPVGGFWAAWMVLRATTPAGDAVPNKARQRRTCARWDLPMLLALVLVAGIVPALTLFAAAWNLSAEGFARRAQVEFLHALKLRREDKKGVVGIDDSDVLSDEWAGGSPKTEPAQGPADRVEANLMQHALPWAPGLREFMAWMAAAFRDGDGTSRLRWTSFGQPSLSLDVQHPEIKADIVGATGKHLRLESQVPVLTQLPWAEVGWMLLLLASALVAVLCLLLHSASRRLFLLDHRNEEVAGPRVWAFSHPGSAGASEIDALVDLERCDTIASMDTRIAQGEAPLFDHLECRLTDERWGAAILARLEALVEKDVPFVLLSEIDPLVFLGAKFEHTEPERGTHGSKVVSRFWRWSTLLDLCDLRVGRPEELAPAAASSVERAALQAKTIPTARADSDASHWRIWSCSTRAEKLAMAQLAQEGFLNPKAHEVLRHLCARGLVTRTPALRIKCDTFRDFVMHAETTKDLQQWEQSESTDWLRGELPALGAAAAAAVYVVVTQPHLLSTGTGIATATVAVVSGASHLMRLASGRGDGGSSGPSPT